jgi:2-polyprenyl-6-methoxyphenol hydroxylase-like FAD-dependent oxidoreductase
MTEHAVVIAGGGPTGLMLAAELALPGVDVAIVERRASQDLAGSRSGGLHGDFPTRHNYGLGLWQNRFEEILAGWVGELAVPIYRGRDVTGFAQDDTGVTVELSDGRSLRAEYLVGCDGGRSLIRRATGIEFPGWDPSTGSLIAEVEMSEEPEFGIRRDDKGIHALGRLDDGERVWVVVREQHLGQTGDPTLRDLSRALVAVRGTDYGLRSATWISRFTVMTRQAASYRNRRVLLAGDAAHVHYPVGGQGLNTGLQDAVNLGWKLAQVVNETSPESLLDTYHAERHPVAARVLRNTMAQVALRRPDERTKALRDTIAELLSVDEPRKRFAAMLSGLDIHYDLGEGHPLLGRRMPGPRPGHHGRPAAGVHPAARRPARAAQLRRAWRLRHHTVGGSGSDDRCQIRWPMGASGTWRGHCSDCRVDPARRICRLGGRPHPRGAPRRAHHLVRTADCDVAHRPPRSRRSVGPLPPDADLGFRTPEPSLPLPRERDTPAGYPSAPAVDEIREPRRASVDPRIHHGASISCVVIAVLAAGDNEPAVSARSAATTRRYAS